MHEVFDGFEQVDEYVVAGADIFRSYGEQDGEARKYGLCG
jgi:hypothetical protein